jgi:type I restriction enzyme S subunit
MEQVKPGYKKTEVGVIPEGWATEPLKKIIELISGQHILANDYNYSGKGVPYFTGPADFLDGIANISKWTDNPKVIAHEGDLLLTVKGSGAGTVFKLNEEKAAISRQLMAIRPNSINGSFLYYLILSLKEYLSKAATGNLIPGIGRKDVLNLFIPKPEQKEQKAIAEALSDVDALIQSLDKLIAKKKAIKQGTMQELLAGKRRLTQYHKNSNYKKTEVGLIPEDWKVTSFGDSFEIYVGSDLKEDAFSSFKDDIYKFPVYSNTVTDQGFYGYYNFPQFNGRSLTIVGRGVGLGTAFARTGSFGAIGRLLVLFPKKDIDPEFVTEYVNSKSEFFSESSGIPQLTGLQLAKYKLPLPPTLEEQQAIAQILSDMDQEIEALEQKREKYQSIKQGMMQELLTGKKRLI